MRRRAAPRGARALVSAPAPALEPAASLCRIAGLSRVAGLAWIVVLASVAGLWAAPAGAQEAGQDAAVQETAVQKTARLHEPAGVQETAGVQGPAEVQEPEGGQEQADPVEAQVVEPAADVDLHEPADSGWLRGSLDAVQLDYARFYRRGRALRFGGVLAGAAALANTSADEEIQEWYRESVRDDSLDELAADVKFLGDGEKIAIPLALAGLALGLGPDEDAHAAVTWLRRTSRGYLVGTPSLLYLQTFTGGDRPSEGGGSGWSPFEGQNGVSGHAFLGAVPFLTLARQTDRRWLEALALLGSTAAGWSRVNDDQHYFSQYALGWWLAWEATDAVAESDALALGDGPTYAVLPLPTPDGAGVLVSLRF